MRRTPSIVALLFALVACGTLGVLITLELRSATPDASPRAAMLQHTERDNGVGGAWIDRSQRVNRFDDDVFFEKLPDRHSERADRRRFERSEDRRYEQ